MTELRWFAIATALIGCSSRAIEVGSNDSGADTRISRPGPDDTEACRQGTQLPIVGSWQGYIENFKLSSGSDAVRVQITSATTEQACGKLILGTAAAPPPPTNPDVGYPPGYPPRDLFDFRTIDMTEGFPMTILGGSATSERMTFTTDSHEFWKSWCELQTPVPDAAGSVYSCLPPTGSAESTLDGCFVFDERGNRGPIDCGKLSLCFHNACTCTVARCTAQPLPDLTFDLRISGIHASGSVMTPNGELHNVYLTQSK